jgi:hypothetical protein
MGYDKCKGVLIGNLTSLLYSLRTSTYYDLAPKIEYWIEYIITEQFTTPEGLAELLSPMAWQCYGRNAEIPRFLKEFRDSPNHSEQMRSFVDVLCLRVLRWFASASADSFTMDSYTGSIPDSGSAGAGFIRVAYFLGCLIKHGLLSYELVRWHVIKPLTLYNKNHPNLNLAITASAIYQLLAAAGNTLLEGFLEPGDVRACFDTVDPQVPSKCSGIAGFDAEKFSVRTVYFITMPHVRT